MKTYLCLKKGLWWAGRMWNKGDQYTGGPPECGKGTDLTKGKNPCFKVIEGSVSIEDEDEEVDDDPRTRAAIINDLWVKYEDRCNPRLKRADLLAREKELQHLKSKDHLTADTEYKVM